MKPNILFITSDQQHWNTIGKYFNEIKTPNLDRLAASGTLFSRAYTVNPTCTPTRATFITGKYPSQHGAWTLGTKLTENEYLTIKRHTEFGYTILNNYESLSDNIKKPAHLNLSSNNTSDCCTRYYRPSLPWFVSKEPWGLNPGPETHYPDVFFMLFLSPSALNHG